MITSYKLTWVHDKEILNDSKDLYLGRWYVGSVYYDSLSKKDDVKKHKVECTLPSIKRNIGHYESEESAKQKLEEVVRYWISRFNENPKQLDHVG